ncbi:VPLPA-CTERM sorting domain-containing protein [Albidovulum aquaemixtae]|uniref:VPLPA-CTERM sorting domain-containing protein n=1 Tax=Albidovulum aquaemixtae TaxID=1542388 RepID=UPI0015E7F340|nr:VPLPA-CTERM sorting domain-containing protein [Defluviimonas aquaemixtae]
MAIFVSMAGAAGAATVKTFCPGAASATTRQFSVTTIAPGATCVATGLGNISGNANGARPDPIFGVLGAGYQLIDKSDSGPAVLNVSGVSGTSGLWSFILPAAPAGMIWTNLVLAFKSGQGGGGSKPKVTGPDWAAFLLPSGASSGLWSISGQQSLSHANLYGQLAPAAVPLPAAGVLMVGALGAFAAVRRRRRA